MTSGCCSPRASSEFSLAIHCCSWRSTGWGHAAPASCLRSMRPWRPCWAGCCWVNPCRRLQLGASPWWPEGCLPSCSAIAATSTLEAVNGMLWVGVVIGLGAALGQAIGAIIARPLMQAGIDPFMASLLRIGVAAACLSALLLHPCLRSCSTRPSPSGLRPYNPLGFPGIGCWHDAAVVCALRRQDRHRLHDLVHNTGHHPAIAVVEDGAKASRRRMGRGGTGDGGHGVVVCGEGIDPWQNERVRRSGGHRRDFIQVVEDRNAALPCDSHIIVSTFPVTGQPQHRITEHEKAMGRGVQHLVIKRIPDSLPPCCLPNGKGNPFANHGHMALLEEGPRRDSSSFRLAAILPGSSPVPERYGPAIKIIIGFVVISFSCGKELRQLTMIRAIACNFVQSFGMLTKQRKQFLLDRLARDGRIVAKELSEELVLSEDTIRRDLRELSAKGSARTGAWRGLASLTDDRHPGCAPDIGNRRETSTRKLRCQVHRGWPIRLH